MKDKFKISLESIEKSRSVLEKSRGDKKVKFDTDEFML